MKKINDFLKRNAHFVVVLIAILSCAFFLSIGHLSEDGKYITLDGNDARIYESTEKIIEDSRDALWRIMNEDAPTDEETIKENEELTGQGGSVTLEQVKSRRLPDGDTDNSRGWQCSKYTAYLATGRREYSSSHPDFGPVNGKDVAAWLVKNYGWQYADKPVEGAIGSGGFNTLYGHTAEYLYPTEANTAMVSDANYVPLTVATHNLDITGWVWVVPGDYTPDTKPEPTPIENEDVSYVYAPGDYFSKVLVKLGLDENNLWGDNGTVRYYTNQLIEQNMLDAKGNVKIGVQFKLVKK